MSPRTLQRQFQESVGFGPYEWLIRERVALAKDMLQIGRHSLAHIADSVGFKSLETFRRHFRRVAGTSPATYRRQFAQR